MLNRVLKRSSIAYFSMEVGLRNDIPTYAGGLGILAGDMIRSSADLRVPLVAVTLVSKHGHFRQEITADGKQIEYPSKWDPSTFMTLLPEAVEVQIQGNPVTVRAWLYECASKSYARGVVPVLFLDTDLDENAPEDREITHFLYGGDERYRLKQEVVLGRGGVKILDALDLEIRRFHMNEGHSSLLTVELLQKHGLNAATVREACIFTTHTPVEAAHDKFSFDLVREVMGEPIPLDLLKRYGGEDRLNMTLLALNLSERINGVSERHRNVTMEMFPGYEVRAITNGVHSYYWTCEPFRELYDTYLTGWANEPELLMRADIIPNEKVWQAHVEAKKELLDFVNATTNVGMISDVLTLGFARRSTAYKRSKLLFSDMERLKTITKRGWLQVIFAGKAHPRDLTGKRLIEELYDCIDELRGWIKIVYLENYNMEMAAKLISGVDVWLNTPLPPMEASGTSGMKAAHNGVINFSVLDGWWAEGWIEDVTGWAIGPRQDDPLLPEDRGGSEINDIYGKLEFVILPKFYREQREWVEMMKSSIGKIASYFNSHRMMRRYATEAYV